MRFMSPFSRLHNQVLTLGVESGGSFVQEKLRPGQWDACEERVPSSKSRDFLTKCRVVDDLTLSLQTVEKGKSQTRHLWVREERPRYGNALLLPAAELHAALPDVGVVSLRIVHNE